MKNQNLVIYDSQALYDILNELNEFLNFKLINVSKKDFSNFDFNKFDDYIILVNNDRLKNTNKLILNDFPIKISNLIEKINIEFLKKKFNKQSHIQVGNYFIDINSRILMKNNDKLDVTEKEINTIIYLKKKISQLLLKNYKKAYGVISLN